MRRLSEIKGEEAIDVLADLMSPISTILADEEIQKIWEDKNTKMVNFVALILKKHKDELITALCLLDNSTRQNYLKSANVISIMKDALYIMNDEEMKEVFTSQAQNKVEESSGSVTGNTKEKEK